MNTFRPLNGKPPITALPAGTIDCHMHVLDNTRFPLEMPNDQRPADALLSHYQQLQQWLGIERIVIVQSNAYQCDNRIIEDALQQLGDKARAVVAVRADVSEDELVRLHTLGVRGARVMDLGGGPIGLSELIALNARTSAQHWSMIVQFDGQQMLQQSPLLASIQGNYVIDHVGKFMPTVSVDSPAFRGLLKLIDRGNCYVKIAGFDETSSQGQPDYPDIAALAKALITHAPERIIWGSNWPHILAKCPADYPDDVQLLDMVNDWAGNELNRQLLFVDNAAKLYGFDSEDDILLPAAER